MTIETENLSLFACDANMLKWAIAGNASLEKQFQVKVPDNWTEFGTPALRFALERLSESEDSENWWTYFPVHRIDKKLIGSGGYKGAPSPEGIVEIGYEISPDYRNRGLATEMVRGLIGNALSDPRTKTIVAHTLGQENPSTSVLRKCGFVKVREISDPDEGTIWRWEFSRP